MRELYNGFDDKPELESKYDKVLGEGVEQRVELQRSEFLPVVPGNCETSAHVSSHGLVVGAREEERGSTYQ
jgi:hypothetical protein